MLLVKKSVSIVKLYIYTKNIRLYIVNKLIYNYKINIINLFLVNIDINILIN